MSSKHRDRDRDREKRRSRDRDRSPVERDRDHRDRRRRDRSRDRDRERSRERETNYRDRVRERERDRERERSERERENDKYAERERDRDRDRNRSGRAGGGRDRRSRSRSRSNEKEQRSRDRDRKRDRDREREREREKIEVVKEVRLSAQEPVRFVISPPKVVIPTAIGAPVLPMTTTPPTSLLPNFENMDFSRLIADAALNNTLGATASKNFAALFNINGGGNSNDSFMSDGFQSFKSGDQSKILGVSGYSSDEASMDGEQRKKKRKSRWGGGDHDKTFIPGMPTILPSTLSPHQQEAYLVQLQIEEISRKLRTGELGISLNPEERSPSPEPIYSSDGKRLNTREFRTRKRLEEQRHQLILRMQCMNPEFKPPADYKPPVIRVSDKVLIPQEQHPDINFVGLLIGPRGNTLKAMEKETGAKIIIRGKGSVKEGKVGRKDGQPLPGEDEPLHAFITASNPECVKKAVDKIKEVIRQGIEVPEGHNDLRRMQLRELAQLNGTLRETDCPRCTNCGSTEHKSWLCPDKPNITNNIVCSSCGGAGHIAKDCRSKRPGAGGPPATNAQAKIDEEYLSLMAELGEAPPPSANDRSNNDGGGSYSNQQNRGMGLFEQRPTNPPRAIMAAAPPPPQPSAPWNQMPPQMSGGMPPMMPPGTQPPPPGPPPPLMSWMPNNQPPPPGSGYPETNGSMALPPPPGTGGPLMPPPPGTTAPPPPPPLMQQQPWGMPQQTVYPWGNHAPPTFIPPPPPTTAAPPPPGAPPPPLPNSNNPLAGMANILAPPPPPPPPPN